MRVSVKNDDPGYCAEAFGATVTVDGEKIDHCFTADEELGEAHCFVFPYEFISGDKIKEEIKRGKVVISFEGRNFE